MNNCQRHITSVESAIDVVVSLKAIPNHLPISYLFIHFSNNFQFDYTRKLIGNNAAQDVLLENAAFSRNKILFVNRRSQSPAL